MNIKICASFGISLNRRAAQLFTNKNFVYNLHKFLSFFFLFFFVQRKLCEVLATGADLGFSRGGGAVFQKNFENFDDLFFRSTKLTFRALLMH